MPRVEISIKTAGGETIVLSPEDRLEKVVTIECCSQRCASRHGQDKPLEVSLVEGQPMPDAGEQWLSLILPERSPQYTPMPPNFCSPSCVRDFLMYQYLAPGPRVETVAEYHTQEQPPVTLPPHSGQVLRVVESESQADGCSDPADCHGA